MANNYVWTRNQKSRQLDWNRLPIDLFNTWWELYLTEAHNTFIEVEDITEDINCFLDNPIKELRRALLRRIKNKPDSEEWCREELWELDTYGGDPSFEEKTQKKSSIDQRTDSNQGKSDTKVTGKNQKIKNTEYFTNCFGMRIKRQN
jgi:hypothetical protein|tara:strand:- start:699 stop:1139 length:441 start_codon:yes stop_codon:yes gene_type:complete